MAGERNHCVRLLGEQSPVHIKEHNHGRREAICARKSQIPRTSENRERASGLFRIARSQRQANEFATIIQKKWRALIKQNKRPPFAGKKSLVYRSGAREQSSGERKKLLLIGRMLTKCCPGVSYLASFMRAFNSQSKLVLGRQCANNSFLLAICYRAIAHTHTCCLSHTHYLFRLNLPLDLCLLWPRVIR